MDDPLNVTKTLYNVSDFLEWQRGGQLNLRPYFQRGNVWTPKSKSYLIDTLLRGYPIPIIYLQIKTDSATLSNLRQVVDGQQRLRTILAFIDIDCLDSVEDRDRFTLMRAHNSELAGKPFAKLPKDARDRLLTTELSVHILPDRLPDSTLLQLFARLNSTGTKLNDQEQRNAEFHGEFKTLAYQLSYAQIDRWRAWSAFSPQALAQMREVELMSDLIMAAVRGPAARTKKALDDFYRENDDDFPESSEVARMVPRVFDEIDDLLEPDSRGRKLGAFQTQSWLYSLFCLLAASRFDVPLRPGEGDFRRLPRRTTRAAVRRGLLEAQDSLGTGGIDKRLIEALRGASTDKRSREIRLAFLADHISG